MKALTIWQPWASLIAIGAKPYEFRGWAAPRAVRGQRIAIHAGARKIVQSEVRALVIKLSGEEPWNACLRRDVALPLLKALLDGKSRQRLSDETAVMPLFGEEPILREAPEPVSVPHSSVVCTAILGDPVRADKIMGEFGKPENDSDRDHHFNWAWPLTAVEPVEPFAPARGAQGFWDWTP